MLVSRDIRHPTLVDRMVDHVFDRVLRRELEPGQRITEDELASDFGVSRTPVREAVKRLAELGVIVVYPRARLEVARVTAEEMCQISQLREDLECLALQYAMPRMSAEDIAHLQSLVARCSQSAQTGSRAETFRHDSEFHLTIVAMSGNRYLADALRRLDVKVQLCRATLCLSREKIRQSVQFHDEIMAAICAHDVEKACSLMRRHIRGTLQQTQEQDDE